MEEIWKDIDGYEGIYQVSNLGRVKSLPRYRKGNKGSSVKVKGGILKLTVTHDGYYRVTLRNNHSRYKAAPWRKVARLVATAFIKNPDDLPVVNHIDGNKLNDNVKNLEWCTVKHNVHHAIDMGLMSSVGENNPRAKLTEDDVRYILKLFAEGNKIKEVADKFNVSKSLVRQIKSGEIWKYIDRSVIQ